MATLNAAVTLQIAQNFRSQYANSIVSIMEGATVLVNHTVTSWTATNTGNNGTATAVIENSGASTILLTGTPDTAKISSGDEIITVSVGLSGSGADLILSSLFFIVGEVSTINSLIVTIPATQA
tara:strand:- start:1228 stop:1599 length:372 start_codon:yes stop_codon:yes gene_type:complete